MPLSFKFDEYVLCSLIYNLLISQDILYIFMSKRGLIYVQF